MKTLYTIILCLFIYENVFCQEDYFIVLASSQNVVKNNKTVVKTGDQISLGDKLILKPKSYICIVNTKGQSIELNKEGNYNIKELSKKNESSQKGIVSKYFELVKDELLKNKNRKDDYGAVVRERKNHLSLNFPQLSYLLDSIQIISWSKYSDNSIYVFRLLSPSNTPVLIKKTSETSIRINFNDINLLRDTSYKIYVQLVDNNPVVSDTSFFLVASEKTKYSVNKELEDLKQYLDVDAIALNEILIGRVYEKYKMNIEALKHYNKALELSNNSREYQNLLFTFIQDCNWNYTLTGRN